jgi:TM2 domain-containing membrane protein YozV
MGEELPGIDRQSRRIEITEADLDPASSPADPSRAQGSQASAVKTAPTELPALVSDKASPARLAGSDVGAGASFCSGCGSAIHPQAVVCPRCGVATATAAQATGAAMNVALNSKSTGLAILLSLVFTGAGHWYVGRVGRGIAFFLAAFISGLLIFALVGLFVLPIVWVWAAIDANKCAVRHNQLLMAEAGAGVPQAALLR